MGNVHYVGAEPLTFERIEEILTGNMKLELTLEVKERIQRCRDYLDRKIETQSEPLYGITTGFGSLCNKNISPDELSTLQELSLIHISEPTPSSAASDVYKRQPVAWGMR